VDWEEIYTAELPRVYNFFRYLTGSDTLAEDLTADTFRKAWQHRQRYDRNRAGFSTWLFTIARRTAVDQFRKQRVDLPLDAAAGVKDSNLPEIQIQVQDDVSRLARILGTYPARERQLIALKYGAGCSYKEIASQLRMSETNVGTLLQRVVRKLRSALEVEE